MTKNIGWKILIPVILLLGILWYQLIYVSTKDKIASYESQRFEVENNMMMEQARFTKKNNMLKELDELKTKEAVTEIAMYDNIQNVMNSLNSILSESDDFSISFSNPTYDAETGLYRRAVSLTFQTSSLEKADKIIRKIYASPYRCVIGSISLGATDNNGNHDGNNSLADDGNNVSMQLTYYEINSK